jgi:hypothetical protein
MILMGFILIAWGALLALAGFAALAIHTVRLFLALFSFPKIKGARDQRHTHHE